MKLLSTPLGTFLKGFAATILSLYLAELIGGHQLFTMDIAMIQKLLTAGLISNVPVIINWLNPHYQGYGVNQNQNE